MFCKIPKVSGLSLGSRKAITSAWIWSGKITLLCTIDTYQEFSENKFLLFLLRPPFPHCAMGLLSLCLAASLVTHCFGGSTEQYLWFKVVGQKNKQTMIQFLSESQQWFCNDKLASVISILFRPTLLISRFLFMNTAIRYFKHTDFSTLWLAEFDETFKGVVGT